MKKISTTIASITLSLLTIGAMAQTMNGAGVKKLLQAAPTHLTVTELPVVHSQRANKQHRIASGATSMELDYGATDRNCVGASAFYYWNPLAYINANYTAADTGAGATKNYDDLNSIIVAYDTIIDANGTGYNAQPGTVIVDTVFAVIATMNQSGNNDSLIVTIASVNNVGYPTMTQVYSKDTTYFTAAQANAKGGHSIDSIYEIYILPNHGLGTVIPNTAPVGSHFAVSISTLKHNSKNDTIGIAYRSQATICGTYGYCKTRTCAGVKMGVAPNVNSYQSGWNFYNTVGRGGNGNLNVTYTWPFQNGDIGNSGGNFGDYWIKQACPPATDTGYLYFQDNWIWLGIGFNDVTGVNNITNESGFSVNQNYPNPFNQQTQITYNLAKSSEVVFSVYDLTGRELVNNKYTTVAPGQHVITLDANRFNPGVYFYSFNVNGNLVTKKMVITQ